MTYRWGPNPAPNRPRDLMVRGVDLGVGVEVAHALDVDHDGPALGHLPRPVGEGMRRVAQELVRHEARVAAAPGGGGVRGVGDG